MKKMFFVIVMLMGMVMNANAQEIISMGCGEIVLKGGIVIDASRIPNSHMLRVGEDINYGIQRVNMLVDQRRRMEAMKAAYTDMYTMAANAAAYGGACYGGGVVAVYNEDLIIDSLTDYGYELKEARKFANDGCWEIQIPGKTFFTYIAFDSLQILQQIILEDYSDNTCFSDFESLYNAFIDGLKNKVIGIAASTNENRFIYTAVPTKDWKWKPSTPCTVVSLFEQGCVENGLSYLEGGPIYNVVSPHIGGLPDVVNSLYAIKKLVFDEQKVTFVQLMQLLKSNWEENETLRQYALNKYSYFGNDNDEVDSIAKNIISDFSDICDNLESGYKTPAGVSTFGRQLEWSELRMATPYGKKAHDILSGNFSPTPGTDKEGATAIIKSYCKADLKRTVSGAALDIKLLPSSVNGENGVEAISSLIKGFVTLGGHFMQLDIADIELLKKAQKHPEEYQNLSVRVSGWNARFVTLNREWQDMIIAQTGSEL